MLAYTVKLTAEREQLESKLIRLRDQNETLASELNCIRNAESAAQFAANESTFSNASSLGTDEPSSVLNAMAESALRHRKRLTIDGFSTFVNYCCRQSIALDDITMTPNDIKAQSDEMAAANGIQTWQLVSVGALCFLLGRII
jgi:hypothetical protein